MSKTEVTKVNLPKFPNPELIALTIEEAKKVVFDLNFLKSFAPSVPNEVNERIAYIENLIEQVENSNE